MLILETFGSFNKFYHLYLQQIVHTPWKWTWFVNTEFKIVRFYVAKTVMLTFFAVTLSIYLLDISASGPFMTNNKYFKTLYSNVNWKSNVLLFTESMLKCFTSVNLFPSVPVLFVEVRESHFSVTIRAFVSQSSLPPSPLPVVVTCFAQLDTCLILFPVTCHSSTCQSWRVTTQWLIQCLANVMDTTSANLQLIQQIWVESGNCQQ